MVFEKDFVFPSEKGAACAAKKAIWPELGKVFERHAQTSIHTNKNIVSLKIIAENEAGLKASARSFGRLLGLCIEIGRVSRGFSD